MHTREWDASTYHRLSNHQAQWGQKVLQRLFLRGDETVVDAGCGSGRVTAELARLLPQGRIIAVDLSEQMLHKAAENLASAASTRVDLLCADLAALPLRNAADGIFSTAAFHWVRDHDRLFRALFLALNPGGWLEAQCGGGPNIAGVRRRAGVVMAKPEFARYFASWREPWTFPDEQTATERLRQAGFTEIRAWTEPAGFAMPTPEDYRQYLITVTLHQHLARVPDPAVRERFLDQVVELAQPELYFDYWRLNLHARKPPQA
jgi:trans-aconitate methyltransferase